MNEATNITPAKVKLTYFDLEGRGETPRLVMALGDLEFEDERIPYSQWPEHKASMPLREVPVLTLDGRQLTQANSINRYLGRLTGLYPDDILAAFLCDEIMDAADDAAVAIVASYFMADEEKKLARMQLLDGSIKKNLTWLNRRLGEAGGLFFADERLTIADVRVYVWVKSLVSGSLDYIPTTFVQEVAPLVFKHYKTMSELPPMND